MKILLNYHLPFALAHGGLQIQVEQTRAALEALGVSVDYMHWWDDKQKGDIIQQFSRIPLFLLRVAQQNGIKVVVADLLTGAGSRTKSRLFVQRAMMKTAERLVPGISSVLNWECYRHADACVAGTSVEAHLITYLYGAPPERVHVIPNGVEQVFFDSPPVLRKQWLVCTATIVERKRVLELAEAALLAETPLWIIGKPYAESDRYARRFFQLAQQHAQRIRYEGAISDRTKLAQIYREARGFVLISTMESLSLSAGEAAACECPLLLSDLPWARTAFGENASYCPVTSAARTAAILRRFYDAAPGLKTPPKPPTWIEVARQLKGVYERLLNTSP